MPGNKPLSFNEFKLARQQQMSENSTPINQKQPVSFEQFKAQRMQQRQQQPELSWGDVAQAVSKNWGKSTGQLLQGIGQTVIHPIDTTQNILNIVNGLVQKGMPNEAVKFMHQVAPQTAGNEQLVNKIGQFYANRYGSMPNIKQAIATDPVGVGFDALSAGSLVTGLLGKTPAFARKFGAKKPAVNINDTIAAAKKTPGMATIPESRWTAVTAETLQGAKDLKKLDPAAIARRLDFERLDMRPLRGQVTRDPIQFAKEYNLRAAIPEISEQMRREGGQLRGLISSMSEGSANQYQSGAKIIGALEKIDKAKAANVSKLYKNARNSAGKDLPLKMQALAKDFATVLDDFGDKVPGAVRKRMNDYGLLTGKQLKYYTVEEADKLLKLINDHVGSDKATNTALGRLRSAVKQSVIDSAPDGGVFAPAVKAAAERFKMHDTIPALKSVVEGKISPDKFISRYVINGNTDDVTKLAALLKENDPATFNILRDQIGQAIERAAYGENLAGDASIAPERFSKMISNVQDKLPAFYNADEIDKINTVARVANYIHKEPAYSTVNRSNTFSGAVGSGLFGKVSKVRPEIDALAKSIIKSKDRRQAFNIDIPYEAMQRQLSPEQQRIFNAAIGLGGTGGLLSVMQNSR